MSSTADQLMALLAPTRPVRPGHTWGRCCRCGFIAYWATKFAPDPMASAVGFCECGHICHPPASHGGPTLELTRDEIRMLPELERRYPGGRAVWEETVKHLIG
jgi:hypothetical protein